METRRVECELTQMASGPRLGPICVFNIVIEETHRTLLQHLDGHETLIQRDTLPTRRSTFRLPLSILVEAEWPYDHVLHEFSCINLDPDLCTLFTSCIYDTILESVPPRSCFRHCRGFHMKVHVKVERNRLFDEIEHGAMLLRINHDRFSRLITNNGNVESETWSDVLDEASSETYASNSNASETDRLTNESRVSFQDIDSIKEGEVGDCIICMVELSSGEPVVEIPCSHMFHEACLLGWLVINNSCPLCRRTVG